MIGILGAGSWGTALALLSAHNGNPTLLWEHTRETAETMARERHNHRYLPEIPFPESLNVTADLDAVVQQCNTLLVVVPSAAFRELLGRLKPLVRREQGLAWATKGLDPLNGQLLHQVAAEVLGEDFPMAVLSGPSFALEVAQRQPTAITLASRDDELANRLTAYLHNDFFRIYRTDDLAGVSLGGSYKNVLAIAAGICDGLELGNNARAAVITRGLAEMRRLGLALGGQAETFMGLAGLGDLVLTCTGDLSRNRRAGLGLARGEDLPTIQKRLGQVTEGVETARVIHKLAKKYEIDLPIAEQVYQVLFEGCPTDQALKALLSRREPAQEF